MVTIVLKTYLYIVIRGIYDLFIHPIFFCHKEVITRSQCGYRSFFWHNELGFSCCFFPGEGVTEYNQDLDITYTKNDVSPTGIGFKGGETSTPVEFDFNGNVNITLKQDDMASDSTWSAYGVWINNSQNGSVNLEFHKDLVVNIQNTTNMGVGLVSGTLYTGVGGATD